MKRILIDISESQTQTAILTHDSLTEFYIDPKTDGSVVGQIILGTVQSILPGQFAFIDIGRKKNAFMNIRTGHTLKTGQPLLVQVYKDASGTKGANVGEQLHLNGRLAILLAGASGEIGVSQKITDKKERERLRGIAVRGCGNHGVIIRTHAEGKPEPEICADIEALTEICRLITERARYAKPPAVLHRENSLLNDLLSDDVSEIKINDRAEYESIRQAVSVAAPLLADRVSFYDETTSPPLFDAYAVKKQVARALRREVWLPCGGFITLEQTEACVIVDVNTGKFAGKKNHRETVLRVNLEAARCVAEQLALRNLSGMIIVDFIDMYAEADKKELIRVLTEAIKKDRIKTDIVGMTELGLVQLTRRKTREPLSRLLECECPHCRGTGRVRKE